MKNIERILEEIRNRRKMRMDALDDEGRWITTEKGHHVHLNEEEEPDAGNPHVLEAMQKGEKAIAKTPKNVMKMITDISDDAWDNIKDIPDRWKEMPEYEKQANKKICDILDSLPLGSVMELPAAWNDGEKPERLVKNEFGKWYSKQYDVSYPIEDIAGYFIDSEKNRDYAPVIKRVARSEESKRAALEKRMAEHWRNNQRTWGDKSLESKIKIRMDGADMDNIGSGFSVVGSDGKTYTKYEGDWFDENYHPLKNKKILQRATVEGDFFDIYCGMNGVPKEECDKAREIFNGMNGKIKTEYENIFKNTEFRKCDESRPAHFDPLDYSISFNKWSDAHTVIHECAHKIGRTKQVERILDDEGGMFDNDKTDFIAMCEEIGYNHDGEWLTDDAETRVKKYMDWAKKHRSKNGFASISDVCDALSLGSCGEGFYGGHGSDYWKNPFNGYTPSMRSTEFWAEYCELKVCGFSDGLDLMQRVSPKMYSVAEKQYARLFA